jgi:hypothetical protein
VTGLGGRGTAVVTGASSGTGGEFARRGHAVVIAARRRYRPEKLAAELTETGAAVEVLVADLTRSYDVGRVAERAARSDVTVLVNSAGVNGYGPFLDAEPLVTADAIALNVTALTLLCRAAITGVAARSTGTVINVCRLLAFSGGRPPHPLPARAIYVGTEAHVVTLPRTLAADATGNEERNCYEAHRSRGSICYPHARRPLSCHGERREHPLQQRVHKAHR